MSWDRDDTERWLKDYPLPHGFLYRGQKVWPRYRLKKGYGFWLRTTPYHQGLFELCHELLAAIPVGGEMPPPEELARWIQREESAQGLLPLPAPMDDDQAPASEAVEATEDTNAF